MWDFGRILVTLNSQAPTCLSSIPFFALRALVPLLLLLTVLSDLFNFHSFSHPWTPTHFRHISNTMRAGVSIRFSPSKLRLLGNQCLTGSTSASARRTFSSTSSNWATWGFIGLGRMGQSRHQNHLRAWRRLPQKSTCSLKEQVIPWRRT